MKAARLGALIRSERERRGLSQEQLARLLPCHRGLISKWERGLSAPDPVWLMRLALALDSGVLRDAAVRLALKPAEQVLALKYRQGRDGLAQGRRVVQAA